MNNEPRASASLMPALLAVVAGILLWTLGEDLRDRMPPLRQQLKAALALNERGSAQELAAAKQQAFAARTERRAWETRLASLDSEQTMRAQVIYDLRRRCVVDAHIATCNVRLSDEGATSPSPATTSRQAAESKGAATLESLGIRKVRAVVSGNFQGGELLALYKTLKDDSSAVWRINGVVVRNNTFELDLERHIRPAS